MQVEYIVRIWDFLNALSELKLTVFYKHVREKMWQVGLLKSIFIYMTIQTIQISFA